MKRWQVVAVLVCALWGWTLWGSALCAAVADADATDTASDDADEARRARVFAKIGSTEITVGNLEDMINQRSPYARKRFEDPEVVRQFADDQVRAELMFAGAEKLGFDEDPQVEAFLGRTILQTFMREEIENAEPPDAISEARIRAYYDEHPDEFRRPEMRRASHILVATRSEALEVLAELEKGALTFGAIAKQRSLDKETRLRGGDLLYFTRDGVTIGASEDAGVDAKLVEEAFSLTTKGDVSRKPIQLGEDQWSVVRLSAVRPARVDSFEDAQSAIRRRLWREGRQGAVDALVLKLREELVPEIHPERMKAIVLEAPAGPVEHPNQ
ncbi:MAG: peptidyl-prolyl cis-trans isomerase [Myxococcota bacterium]